MSLLFKLFHTLRDKVKADQPSFHYNIALKNERKSKSYRYWIFYQNEPVDLAYSLLVCTRDRIFAHFLLTAKIHLLAYILDDRYNLFPKIDDTDLTKIFLVKQEENPIRPVLSWNNFLRECIVSTVNSYDKELLFIENNEKWDSIEEYIYLQYIINLLNKNGMTHKHYQLPENIDLELPYQVSPRPNSGHRFQYVYDFFINGKFDGCEHLIHVFDINKITLSNKFVEIPAWLPENVWVEIQFKIDSSLNESVEIIANAMRCHHRKIRFSTCFLDLSDLKHFILYVLIYDFIEISYTLSKNIIFSIYSLDIVLKNKSDLENRIKTFRLLSNIPHLKNNQEWMDFLVNETDFYLYENVI